MVKPLRVLTDFLELSIRVVLLVLTWGKMKSLGFLPGLVLLPLWPIFRHGQLCPPIVLENVLQCDRHDRQEPLRWPPRVTVRRLLPHARGLGFKPRREGFPSGAKKEWGLSPKAKVRVLHTAQLDVTGWYMVGDWEVSLSCVVVVSSPSGPSFLIVLFKLLTLVGLGGVGYGGRG
nr:hypothetical protein [Tanacetum cinerariifolium]